MDLFHAINTRRSVRKFTGEIVEDQDLKTILQAGFQAPSAHNFEPREYIIVKDPNTLEEIAAFHKYAKMLPNAGCAIVVCGDNVKQNRMGFLVSDCSASIQNMLLAAHGLGLGAVWCGLYPKDDLVDTMTDVLNLPEHIIPIGMIAVGVKDREPSPIDRYDESRIRYDKW